MEPAVTGALALRHRQGIPVSVVVVADHRRFHAALTETGQALGPGDAARVIGGLAYEPKSAETLGGEQNGRLGRSLLLRTARNLAGRLSVVPQQVAAAGRR